MAIAVLGPNRSTISLGATASRSTSPSVGQEFFNTDTNTLEVYNGTWLPASPSNTVSASTFKPATTSITTNTTLTTDPDLSATLTAGTWLINLHMNITSGTTAGFAFKLVYSGSVTNNYLGYRYQTDATTGAGAANTFFTTAFVASIANANIVYSITGGLVVTAGTLTVQWAQNSSSATTTSLRVGSFLTATKTA